MKRYVTGLLVLAAVIGLLAGCGGNKSTADDTLDAGTIWDAVVTRLDEDAFPVLMELDDASLSSYYGLTDSEVADYIGQLPMMNVRATELLIVKANKDKADEVRAAMEKRQADLAAIWSSYLPDQYALVQDYRIVENGNWLLFVVAGNADDIVAIFDEYTKQS